MDTSQKISGRFYAGRALLRHEDEPSYTGDEAVYDSRRELRVGYPETVPHVFVDVNGVSVGELLMSPSNAIKGSSGTIVKHQKLVRDKASVNEVQAWRESFVPEMLLDGPGIEWLAGDEEEVVSDISEGAPFVILDSEDIDLDVPKQPEDIREELLNVAPEKMHDQIRSLNDAELRQMHNALVG